MISFLHETIKYIIMVIVGPDFSGPAQDAWDLRPTSLVQWICRKYVKELGFGAWTKRFCAEQIHMVIQNSKLRNGLKEFRKVASRVFKTRDPY